MPSPSKESTRSSQQLSAVKFVFKISTALFFWDALVPLVFVLSGRDAGSRGGCGEKKAVAGMAMVLILPVPLELFPDDF